MCEEFHCLPSVARKELLYQPSGYITSLLQARAFRKAWGMYAHAETAEKTKMAKDGGMFKVCEVVEFARAGKKLKASRAKRGPRKAKPSV